MKLTWFASTCLRLHIAGQIIVFDPDRAPAGVEPLELTSGADRVVSLAIAAEAIPEIDPTAWRRRPPRRPLDDIEGAEPRRPEVTRLGEAALLVDGDGEPPVVLVAGPNGPEPGRWADGAVVVLFGASDALVAWATVVLDIARPRLVALAADSQDLDQAIDALHEHLDGVGLVSLEPGLAVET